MPSGGTCVCPPAAPNKCGPDCCTGTSADPYPRPPTHSECGDNECCFGTYLPEEFCCPTNTRAGGLPPLATVCLATNECCQTPSFCCVTDGCCDTICFGGRSGNDSCCPDADFCPGGSTSADLCCTGNTTCCGSGTNANACIDLTVETNCCVEGDCGDPCLICNQESHTCVERCPGADDVCCTEQAGPGICVRGNCCPGAPCGDGGECCPGATPGAPSVCINPATQCCIEADCGDPCRVCNLRTHTCDPRCLRMDQVCCTEQAGPGVCVTGECCLGAPCNFLPDDDDDDDGLCCQTPEGTICIDGEVCPGDCTCPEGTTCCRNVAGAVICVVGDSCDCDNFCGPATTGPNSGNFYCCNTPDYTICCEGPERECCGGPSNRQCQATGRCCEAATPFYCPGSGSTEPVCCATPCNPLDGTCTPPSTCETIEDCDACQVCQMGICEPCASVGNICCNGTCVDEEDSFSCGDGCCPIAEACCDTDGCCAGACYGGDGDRAFCCEAGAGVYCPVPGGPTECCNDPENVKCCGTQGCCGNSQCNEEADVCCEDDQFACGTGEGNQCCDTDTEKCCEGACIPASECCAANGDICPTCEPNCECSDASGAPINVGLDCNGGIAAGGGVCACGYCVVPLEGCPCGCAGDTECVRCAATGGGVCETYNQGGSCNGGAGICDGEWCVDAPPVDCDDACLYRCDVIENGCDCGVCPSGQFCMDSGWCCPGTGLGTDANCAYCGDVCPGGTTCQGGVCTGTATCTSDGDCGSNNCCEGFCIPAGGCCFDEECLTINAALCVDILDPLVNLCICAETHVCVLIDV